MSITSQLELHFQSFIKGEEKGMSFIYNHLFQRLFKYACTIITNSFEINSIVHNAFLRTWMRREEIKDILHLQRYLFCSVRWGCYQYLNKNYYRKRIHLLPGQLLVSNQSEEYSNENATKYKSGELLPLIEKAIPYLNVSKKILLKLHTYGLSHRIIHKTVSEQYKSLTQDIYYRMKVLKKICRKIRKVEDGYSKEIFISESGILNYLSPLQYKIFQYYYENKYSLNDIAEELNISPLKILKHHFYIIRLFEKFNKKLSR